MAIGLPPWLDVSPQQYLGAEEAGAHLGLAREAQRRIGQPPDDQSAAIAQENIANQFKAQEMARQQQQDALQQQNYEAQVKLQADQLARKYQAMQQYKSRIAGGEDPLKVLMELGPEAGLGASAEAAAIRAAYQKPRPTRQVLMPEVQYAKVGDQSIPYVVDRNTGGFKFFPPGYLPKTAKDQPMSQAQREHAIVELTGLREKMAAGAPYPSFVGLDEPDATWSPRQKAQFKSYKASLDKIDKQIEDLQKSPSSAGGLKVLSISEEGQSPQSEMPPHDDEE